jgi:hypothetical protein
MIRYTLTLCEQTNKASLRAMGHSLQLGEIRQAAKKFTAYPPSIAQGRGLFLAQHKP